MKKRTKICFCLTLGLLLFVFPLSGCEKATPETPDVSKSSENEESTEDKEVKENETGKNEESAEKWIPISYTEEELEDYHRIILAMSSPPSPEKAIRFLYLSPSRRMPAQDAPEGEALSVSSEDEKNALVTVRYFDGGSEEISLTWEKNEGNFGIWIPVKYRVLTPPLYEEKFAILSLREGEIFYDEAEWIDHFDQERIRELEEKGVSDMGFENGYYVYNGEENPLALHLTEETSIYMLTADLAGFELQGEEELRKAIEQDLFSGYFRLCLKDGKAAKIRQVYVP